MSLSALATDLACSTPRSFSWVSVWPWKIPSAFAWVSPCLISQIVVANGWQGSVLGVIIGTAVLVVLRNAILMWGFDTDIEFAIIGLVILAGVIVDELVKRYAARPRARRSAAAAEAAAA